MCIQEFTRAVIFHANDKQQNAEAGAASARAAAGGAPVAAPHDDVGNQLKHFIRAVKILRDLRDVFVELQSEFRTRGFENVVRLQDVDGNERKWQDGLKSLKKHKEILQVCVCVHVCGCLYYVSSWLSCPAHLPIVCNCSICAHNTRYYQHISYLKCLSSVLPFKSASIT